MVLFCCMRKGIQRRQDSSVRNTKQTHFLWVQRTEWVMWPVVKSLPLLGSSQGRRLGERSQPRNDVFPTKYPSVPGRLCTIGPLLSSLIQLRPRWPVIPRQARHALLSAPLSQFLFLQINHRARSLTCCKFCSNVFFSKRASQTPQLKLNISPYLTSLTHLLSFLLIPSIII